jgi:hypothetical protein
MFKAFSDSSRNQEFHGFPNLNFQMNNEAYGFGNVDLWFDAAYGLNTQTDGANISFWKDRIQNLEFNQTSAANQPVLRISDSDFNNLPSVDFNTTSKILTNEKGFVVSGTIAFVVKASGFSANGNVLFSDGIGSGVSERAIMLAGETTAKGIGVYNSSSITGVASIIINSGVRDLLPHIVVFTKTAVIIDGIIAASGPTLMQLYKTIGSILTTTGGRHSRAKLPEFITFKNQFTDDEALTICDRLNSKYAIY